MDLVENEDAVRPPRRPPGLTAEDVKIEFEHNVLTISGERRSEQRGAPRTATSASSARPARSPAR